MARKLSVEIVGDASSLKRAFGDANSQGSKFGSVMGGVVKAGALAAGAAIGGLAVVAVKSVKAAQEAEVSQTQMANALNALGVSYQEHAKQIDTVIEKQSKLAALDDEELQDSFTRLARVVGGDVNEALRLNAIAADVARAKGIELEAATGIVTKAALGQVGSLKRQGIEIKAVTTAQDELKASGEKATEAQKRAAKEADLVATKHAAIAALQRTFAGAAEAYGETSAGAAAKFRVALENLQEKLGGPLLASASQAAEALSGVVDWISKLSDKISDAPTWKLKFEVAREALTDLKTKITEALFGKTEAGVVRIDSLVVKVQKVETPGLADRVETAVKAEFAKIDWSSAIAGMLGNLVRGFWAVTTQVGVRINLAIVDGIRDALLGHDWSSTGASVMRSLGHALDPRPLASELKSEATRLGKAIIDGIGQGLAPLRGWVSEKLSAISGALSSVASQAAGWAAGIGRGIADGVVSGIGDIGSRIYNAAAGGIMGAIDRLKSLAKIGSPSRLTADEIGKPLGEGIIAGFLLGSASLPQQMADKVREGLERAKQTIQDARGDLSAAFSDLASAGSEALDKLFGGPTKSERKLQAMELARQTKEIADRIKEARAALAEAQRGEMVGDVILVDEEAVKAAQKALADALFEQTRFNLERQAELERAKRDEQLALRRRHFEERLAALQVSLEKEGATQQEAHQRVMALFKSFGIDYRKSGRALGAALAEGILDSMGAVEQAASEIARVIAKYLKTRSPAELGPLSDLDTWAKGFASTWAGGLDTRGMQGALASAASPIAGGSGGGTHIHLHGGTYIGTNLDQAAGEIYAALLRRQGRQTSLGFR